MEFDILQDYIQGGEVRNLANFQGSYVGEKILRSSKFFRISGPLKRELEFFHKFSDSKKSRNLGKILNILKLVTISRPFFKCVKDSHSFIFCRIPKHVGWCWMDSL